MTRVQEAVKDEAWQEFRRSLKGLPTAQKLDRLQEYWEAHKFHDYAKHAWYPLDPVPDCDQCIQVDNYLKALMRGGQIEPFLCLSYFVHVKEASRKWRDVMVSRTIDGHRRKVSVIRK